MKKINRFLLTTGLAATLAMSTACSYQNNTSSSDFSAKQKEQIEQIVHDYLVNNPKILIEVSQKLQQQQEEQIKQLQHKAQKVIPSIAQPLLHDKESPVAGNPNGDVTIVEFFDYQCPHCKDMTAIVDDLVAKDGNVRVVYKQFPIFNDASKFAAEAALASAQQGKYQAFHDALMHADNPLSKEKILSIASSVGINTQQLQKDMQNPAIKKQLKENVKLAQQLGVIGTPAFVIANSNNPTQEQSRFLPGVTNEAIMQRLIQQVRGS